MFSPDNNGYSITLPALGANGAPSAAGTLTFGIGTLALALLEQLLDVLCAS